MLDEETQTLIYLDQPIQIVRKFRARRLTISMRVDRPIRVTSNLSTTPTQIFEFLKRHEAWIEKNLRRMEEQNRAFQKPELKEGALFPFLGELKYLKFLPASLKKIFFTVEEGFLIGHLPRGVQADAPHLPDIETELQNFYKREAVADLQKRVDHWVQATKLQPSAVQFRRPQTRWGSCNSKKKIVLNWKLICYPPALIDYVIIHELCHLKYLNHSKAFWDFVAEWMPEYKTYEKILNEQVPLCRFLNDK